MTTWLARDACAEIERQANAYFPLETGGVLLGWRDGDDRIVVSVLGPGPKSLHGRHAFLPDHQWQVAEINRAFSLTNGDLDYLGDWHTHPGGIAIMSREDGQTLRRIARRVRNPLMGIAAGDPTTGWTFKSWLQPPKRLLQRMEPIAQDLRLFDPPSEWPRLCP